MKTVILSASTGGGHMSAAYAINDYLISQKTKSEVIDAIEYISPILNKTINEIYEYIAIKKPKIWKAMYNSSNKKSVNKIVAELTGITAKKLIPLLNNHKPDVIITTHPFTTEMVSRLKTDKIIDIPLVCVITDYAPHRTWTSSAVDAYVVANSGMINSMKEMGVNPDIIHPFGIPVDDSFYVKENKSEILEKIGLCSSLPTVLIMAGKGGLANIDSVYSKLQNTETNFQIIIITGKNKKLYSRIKNLSEGNSHKKVPGIFPRISKYIPKFKHFKFKIKFKKLKMISSKEIKKTKVIYFTDEVEKYMKAADLIITKPGGLTVSEALACNLPMALFSAIPGQEEENANFLVSNNMAVKLEKNEAETIKNLLENPDKLCSMKYSCENFDKSGSLRSIFELIKKFAVKEKIINKLVRDNISLAISKSGNTAQTEIVKGNVYSKCLNEKLLEECKEAVQATVSSEKAQELADVLEVIYAMAKDMGLSFEDIEKLRLEKRKESGGFESGIFLKKIFLTSQINN